MPVTARKKPPARSPIKTPMPLKGLPPLVEAEMDPQEKLKLNKALVSAANSGMLSKVKKLVEQGADVNYKNPVGLKGIDYARAHRYDEVVEYLKSKGAN